MSVSLALYVHGVPCCTYTDREGTPHMINFDIDGTEYTAEIVTLAQFEADHYDDAILEGAGFTGPDGQTYVVLAPKPVA